MKLTGWYDGWQWPVRVGVYERDADWYHYSFWNGYSWGFNCQTLRDAEDFKWAYSTLQTLPWRGVAK